MNLGIEYMLRSGAIRNFFETPCSLFVESIDGQNGKVVSIQEAPDRPDSYISRLWHLDRNDISLLPSHDDYFVPKEQLFEHDKVILPHYRPLPYVEQPVMSSRNTYKSPMDRIDYAYFINNYLYTSKHRTSKTDWLWHVFMMLNMRDLTTEDWSFMDYWERRRRTDHEQSYVRTKYKQHWFQWVMWRNELVMNEQVAPELVFRTAFRKVSEAASFCAWASD